MKTTNTKTTNAKAKVTKPVAKTEQKPEVKVEPKVSYFKDIFSKCGSGTVNTRVDESYVTKLLGYFKSR
jgi:hypothetical protein